MTRLHTADADYLRAVLDAYPSPVLVLDEGLAVHDLNRAGSEFFAADRSVRLRRRCGDVLHCLQARTAPSGCGTGPACEHCVIRGGAREVFRNGTLTRTLHELLMENDAGVRQVWFRVSSSPVLHQQRPLALVVLEDVTELIVLRRLIPMCAHCRKVRDDSDYWQNVEEYMRRHAAVSFTHGLCPDCIQELYPELLE